jgi:hypothetical protein
MTAGLARETRTSNPHISGRLGLPFDEAWPASALPALNSSLAGVFRLPAAASPHQHRLWPDELRSREAGRVEEEQVSWRHHRNQDTGENRAEDLAGRVCSHDPPVGGHQVVAADHAGNRRELAAI